jgi:hypothetical protein
MSDNIPPVAKGVICIDFDGTIFQWGDMYEGTPPFMGAIDVIRELKKRGWEIVILTSRMSPTWWAHEGMDIKKAFVEQQQFVTRRLENFGIPFDRITAEKVPAEYYIDDKAIRFEGKDSSWKEIGKVVLK